MENNEIMNYEALEGEIVTDEKPGLGTGAAMLIGAGVTLAVTAGIKLVKNIIAGVKAKKEAAVSEDDEQDA